MSGDEHKMEKRRLIWTTYRNINIWFENLKHFLIDKRFVCEKTYGDRLVLNELVYFESQSNRVLNIDESEVSTDGTSKISGGRPLTNLFSTDSDLPNGEKIGNKSGYSATFIGVVTLSGWPIPAHLQVKSEGQAENIKISIDFLKMHRMFEVFFDLVKW